MHLSTQKRGLLRFGRLAVLLENGSFTNLTISRRVTTFLHLVEGRKKYRKTKKIIRKINKCPRKNSFWNPGTSYFDVFNKPQQI